MPKYKNEVNIQNVIEGIVAATVFFLVGIVKEKSKDA